MFLRILALKPLNYFSHKNKFFVDIYLNVNNIKAMSVRNNEIQFQMSDSQIFYLTGDNTQETETTIEMIMDYISKPAHERPPYIELNDITHYARHQSYAMPDGKAPKEMK